MFSEDKIVIIVLSWPFMGFPYPYPLGLPKGSVRSTITMGVSINLLLLTYNGSKWAESLSTMVAVALTFYFGGRMRSGHMIVPRDTIPSQRAWGLPAGTIRTLLFLMFVGFTGYIFYDANFSFTVIPRYLQEIVNIIIGYVVGRTFNRVKGRFIKKKDLEGNVSQATLFDHFKALAVLGLVGFVIYLTQFDPNNDLVLPIILTTSVFLGFYFGERS